MKPRAPPKYGSPAHHFTRVKRQIGVIRTARSNGPRDPFKRLISRERQAKMIGAKRVEKSDKTEYSMIMRKAAINTLRQIGISDRKKRNRIIELTIRIGLHFQEYVSAVGKSTNSVEGKADIRRIAKSIAEDRAVLSTFLGKRNDAFDSTYRKEIEKWTEL